MKRRISRERLEALLWMQYENIEGLSENVRLLRTQNYLLRQQNESLRNQLGLLPVVRPYSNKRVKNTNRQKGPGKTYREIETGEEG